MMPMLKRLRRQLTALTCGLVGLILAAVLAGYCYSTYQSYYGQIQVALTQAIEKSVQDRTSSSEPVIILSNQGFMIIGGNGGSSNTDTSSKTPSSNTTTPSSSNNTAATSNSSSSNSTDSHIDVSGGSFIPVYSVTVNSNLTIVGTSSSSVSMSDELATQAISAAVNSGRESGQLNNLNLFYKLKKVGGVTHIAFTDSASLFNTLYSTIFTSAVIGIIALLFVFFVALLLARLALRPVQEAWVKQRRFVADASHELKTPLTVILANTEIVRENPESSVAEQDKWLAGTLEESRKMEELIQDLLMMAQTESDALVESYARAIEERVNLSDLVATNAMQFEAVAFEQHVTMNYDNIEPDLWVKGVPAYLERLVRILIDNACKYAGSPGEITLSLVSRGKDAVLTVENSGETICPEDLPHVFDRFFRADTARSDDHGHGLGLSIAKNIVDAGKGTICVTSEPGASTVFTVELPLA